MRLTKKDYISDLNDYTKVRYTCFDGSSIKCDQGDYNDNLWEKVKIYEDIEEELGIDLSILFKALDECYVNGHKGTAMIINSEEIGIKYQLGEYSWSSRICKIKDYGKTWALTKEELEDGN